LTHDAVIHLIDDDDDVRHALAFLLTASGYAVRAYTSGDKFLEALPTLQPGCIITDVRMPGLNGLELQRALNIRQLKAPVIVMTGHGDIGMAVDVMKAGAVDFLEKPVDDEALLAAVRAASERHVLNARRDDEVAEIQTKLSILSPREAEVLNGLIAGHANKLIAYELGISARTVEVHRANVMTKMGAASLSVLVRMVLVARSSPAPRD
jgi:two-component system response regulator FixJ